MSTDETREHLIRTAKRRHDRMCGCDPRYLMSCPRMAKAILDSVDAKHAVVCAKTGEGQ